MNLPPDDPGKRAPTWRDQIGELNVTLQTWPWLDTLQTLWAQVRPMQQHQLGIMGFVANDTQQDEDHDQRTYNVLMDFVPALQPWSLQTPIEF